MVKFGKYLAELSINTIQPLLLCHTCVAIDFKSMAKCNRIEPSYCKKFNEKLIYLFYGRPAYRTDKENKPGDTSKYPVCIVVNPEKLSTPKRMAPFDTGAFKYYKKVFNGSHDINDFLMIPNLESARKLVSNFYGSNTAYMESRPAKLKELPSSDIAKNYLKLLHIQKNSSLDSRKDSIELQYSEPIILDNSFIDYIIVPKSTLIDDKVLSTFLEVRFKNKFESYPTFRGCPNEFISTIFTSIVGYYEKQGLLNDS